MALKLHDSLTRTVRLLSSASSDGIFRFYNCGPTVYAPAHIGNFRTFVVNDVIRRLLELEFGPGKVRHVRNLTDVDDKTIRCAREEGRPLAEVTRQWTEKFHADCAALNCLPPHEEPRATDPRFLREQVRMIEVLLGKGNAYRSPDGSVYFRVASFSDYGRLSRLQERELQPGSALKVQAADADEKEDGSDFALWKAWKPEDGPNKWPGPQGTAEGRPGWHIECSAMSKALLGETIDLHTGGVDLLFPHHENEIAQSECCNGRPFARHWFHSEHLLVDGKKMSKSLGTLYTLDDLTAKGFSPMAVRYALLAGHPRKQQNFTLDGLRMANRTLKNLAERLHDLKIRANALFHRQELTAALAAEDRRKWASFEAAWGHLSDDLNLPGCLGAAFEALREINERDLRGALTTADALVEFQAAVRLLNTALGLSLPLRTEDEAKTETEIPSHVRDLAERRWAAKQAKDYATADALRQELAAQGWSMLDRKDGYTLEPLRK